MKNNILKKIMITGLISTVPVSGVFIGNLTTNNAKTLNTSYAVTIKDTAYSATGKTNVNLSLRKGPATSYTKITTLKKGTSVTIIAKSSNGWYKIKYKNGDGYVSSQYITLNNTKPSIQETSYSATGTVTSNLNVRKGPNTTYAKIGSLKKDSKVTIIAKTSNNWYKVKFNSGYAYVSSQYISLNTTKPSIQETSYSATGTATSNLNVRKGPNTTYNKIGYLEKNSKVTIVAKTSNNWYKIKFNSGYAYVSSQYINISNNIDEESETIYYATGVTTDSLNVRKGPSTTYAKVGSLKKDSEVVIVSKTSNNWYKILFDYGFAYVSGQYINITEVGDLEFKYDSHAYITSNLNVRKGPGTEYEKIGSLKKNDKVEIVAMTANGWRKIKYNNSYGYIYGEYVKLL